MQTPRLFSYDTAYDFLPVDPTSPETAVALASGGTVAGILRTRRMESRGI